jgi:hypothetical protein
MQTILARLKSPVVILQILATIVGVVIFFLPNQAQTIQVIDGAVIAIINLLSGLNNPTNPSGF